MNLFARKKIRPKPMMVYGIEVKKQPTLAYIEATERISGLLMELLDAAFPGMTPSQVLEFLTKLDTASFKELAGRLMTALPRATLQILREIVGAQDTPAWDSLTPFEHSEVVKAFWELNDLSAFFMNARSVLQQAVTKPQDTGLNALSQDASQ